MKEVELPSGRKIEITPAPMAEAKKLYQALASELMRIQLKGTDEQEELIKNVICLAISSPLVDAALAPCIKRCTYEGLKITDQTFESTEAREDYLDLCFEVTKENVSPFMKSLFAQFRAMSAALGTIHQSSASRTKTV